MSEEELDDDWKMFSETCADACQAIERKNPGTAAVLTIVGIEKLLEARHSTPPGMVSCSLSFNPAKFENGREIIDHIVGATPTFSINDAADWMGVPEEVQGATLKTIEQAWEFVQLSVDFWKMALTDLDAASANGAIHAYKVCFIACVFLRNWGLWHGNHTKSEVRRGVDPLDQWEMFTTSEQLAHVIRNSKPLMEFHKFNMTGTWED